MPVSRRSSSRLAEVLSKRPASAVLFLYGEEFHLREEAVSTIVEAFLDPATRDFNLDQLRGPDVTAEDLASIIATPPMMAEHRLVIVRDAQGLSAKGREVVEEAAAAPPPGLVLVVVAQIPAGSKAKFYSTMQQRAVSVEFSAIDPLDLPGWLTARATETHGLTLELEAARALVASVGGQLGVLSSELEKLASFVQGRTRITVEDVRAVGGYIPQIDRWKWLDSVSERRFGDALATVPDLLSSGEGAVALVIAMGSQLLRLGIAVSGGREALERELRSNQRWLINDILQLARGWTEGEVQAALEELLRTDRLLKSASLTDRQALEELLLRLADRVSSRRAA